MKKIIMRIKKFFLFIVSRSFYLFVGISISITVYVVNAAWNTDVVDGDSLTPSLWNSLKDEVQNNRVSKSGDDITGDLTIDGRVGIGTTTLNANLQVNPKVNTEGIRIVSSNFSPLVIRNTTNTVDLARIDQIGTFTSENIRKPIWSTNTPGTYSLQTIFTNARNAFQTNLPNPSNADMAAGVYDCVLATSNIAHARGVRFSALVNAYADHVSFPHKIFNFQNIDFGSAGGCADGLNTSTAFYGGTALNFDFTSFAVSGCGVISAGGCCQSISLVCDRIF